MKVVKLEVLMMVNFKIMVFWFMTSPDLLNGTNISNEPDATISYHKKWK